MLTHLFEPSFFVKIYRCLPIVNLSLCCICQKNVKKTSKVISNNHHVHTACPIELLACCLNTCIAFQSNLSSSVPNVNIVSRICKNNSHCSNSFSRCAKLRFLKYSFLRDTFSCFFCVWNMKKEIEMFRLVFNLKEKRTGDPNLDRHL